MQVELPVLEANPGRIRSSDKALAHLRNHQDFHAIGLLLFQGGNGWERQEEARAGPESSK